MKVPHFSSGKFFGYFSLLLNSVTINEFNIQYLTRIRPLSYNHDFHIIRNTSGFILLNIINSLL